MAHVSISSARDNFAHVLELSRTEAIVLERYGRPAAVLVSSQQYEKLVAALDDVEDAEVFDAAMQEEGANVSWKRVTADLG